MMNNSASYDSETNRSRVELENSLLTSLKDHYTEATAVQQNYTVRGLDKPFEALVKSELISLGVELNGVALSRLCDNASNVDTAILNYFDNSSYYDNIQNQDSIELNRNDANNFDPDAHCEDNSLLATRNHLQCISPPHRNSQALEQRQQLTSTIRSVGAHTQSNAQQYFFQTSSPSFYLRIESDPHFNKIATDVRLWCYVLTTSSALGTAYYPLMVLHDFKFYFTTIDLSQFCWGGEMIGSFVGLRVAFLGFKSLNTLALSDAKKYFRWLVMIASCEIFLKVAWLVYFIYDVDEPLPRTPGEPDDSKNGVIASVAVILSIPAIAWVSCVYRAARFRQDIEAYNRDAAIITDELGG